eukprot:11565-Heterococcus_DN1.PRE.1
MRLVRHSAYAVTAASNGSTHLRLLLRVYVQACSCRAHCVELSCHAPAYNTAVTTTHLLIVAAECSLELAAAAAAAAAAALAAAPPAASLPAPSLELNEALSEVWSAEPAPDVAPAVGDVGLLVILLSAASLSSSAPPRVAGRSSSTVVQCGAVCITQCSVVAHRSSLHEASVQQSIVVGPFVAQIQQRSRGKLTCVASLTGNKLKEAAQVPCSHEAVSGAAVAHEVVQSFD